MTKVFAGFFKCELKRVTSSSSAAKPHNDGMISNSQFSKCPFQNMRVFGKAVTFSLLKRKILLCLQRDIFCVCFSTTVCKVAY